MMHYEVNKHWAVVTWFHIPCAGIKQEIKSQSNNKCRGIKPEHLVFTRILHGV